MHYGPFPIIMNLQGTISYREGNILAGDKCFGYYHLCNAMFSNSSINKRYTTEKWRSFKWEQSI